MRSIEDGRVLEAASGIILCLKGAACPNFGQLATLYSRIEVIFLFQLS